MDERMKTGRPRARHATPTRPCARCGAPVTWLRERGYGGLGAFIEEQTGLVHRCTVQGADDLEALTLARSPLRQRADETDSQTIARILLTNPDAVLHEPPGESASKPNPDGPQLDEDGAQRVGASQPAPNTEPDPHEPFTARVARLRASHSERREREAAEQPEARRPLPLMRGIPLPTPLPVWGGGPHKGGAA